MDNFINILKNEVNMQVAIIILAVIAAIVIISFIIRSTRVSKARKELNTLELKYVELKGVPLSFKLNKAVALSKVNHSLEADVKDFQKDYEETQELLREYSVLLTEIDDLVYTKKVKKVNEPVKEIFLVVEKAEIAIKNLDDKLEEVLKQENRQRENINALKERFRNAKRILLENRASYHQSVEFLEGLLKNIEEQFSVFEEWMFASEFDKAADTQNEIEREITQLEVALTSIPSYYEQVKITLLGAVDELDYLYRSSLSRGVYLKHLEIDQYLDILKQLLSDMLSNLSLGKLATMESDIDDCEVRIMQIKENIDKEIFAFTKIYDSINGLFDHIKVLNQNIQKNKELYDRVHERFGFENLSDQLQVIDNQVDAVNELRYRIEKVMNENSIPYTTIAITYDDLINKTTALDADVKQMSDRLLNACSDEERSKQQLIKLQLIINEVRVKIEKHRLPSISDKYHDDIIQANCFIHEVKTILAQTPLDIDSLNAKLNESIDYIYTLYNSVNNLVGMAMMVEQAILFGNKYRSEYVEVDSELTRAELCFNNGQYTKALKIAMSIIERLHPGAYEKIIRKGASFDEAAKA